jgi:glucose/arabinose dehydrogenase
VTAPVALALFLFAMQPPPPVAAGVLPPDLIEVVLARGLTQPTVMTFAPDGRLFVGEKAGTVRVVRNGTLLGQPLLTAPAPMGSGGERGLLGLALHPNFTANGYVYIRWGCQWVGSTVGGRGH